MIPGDMWPEITVPCTINPQDNIQLDFDSVDYLLALNMHHRGTDGLIYLDSRKAIELVAALCEIYSITTFQINKERKTHL